MEKRSHGATRRPKRHPKSVARRHATIKKGSQIQSRGVSRQLTMSKRSSKNATARRLATENQIFYFFSHGVARRLATQHACFFSLPRGVSVNVIRTVLKKYSKSSTLFSWDPAKSPFVSLRILKSEYK